MKYGCHHTAEARAKISQAGMGRIITEEHRANLSKALMGIQFTEEHKQKLSKAQKANCQNLEYKAHMSKVRTGRVPTEEARANMRESQIGRTHTEETKAKMSGARKVRWQDPEYRAIWEERWQNPEYKDRVMRAMRLGCHIHPNKPELLLLGLLESVYPGEWEFVGDGQLIIAGRNPDFWNGDHKLLEMWGNYWHQGENPEDRIRLFKEHGYDTLIIWEEELKYPDKVLERIAEFIRTPLRAE